MRKTGLCGGVLAFALLWLNSVEAREVEVKCPEFCQCDMVNNFPRAVCQDRRLVSIELNIPPQVEILDLSDNMISELGDKIFLDLGLTHLKLLNLSHNKIRQIHFNAFMGLEGLKTLDLSFNAIEYFTKSWFENLKSLEELYLRGNKLRTINEEAQIAIITLRVLDLSQCGITSLKADTFKQISNLEVLDISDNFLQIMQVDVLKALPKLTNLKADNNNFNCKDRNLVKIRKYVRSQKIAFSDFCLVNIDASFSVNHKVHKFERMEMQDDANDQTVSSTPRNSWIFDDRKDNTKIINICFNGTNSTDAGTDGYDDNADGSLLMEIIRLSPWLTLSITFVYGVLCGMVLLCAINLCIKKHGDSVAANPEMPDGSINRNIRNSQNVPKPVARRNRRSQNGNDRVLYSSFQRAKKRLSREVLEDDDWDETLVLSEFDLANSTPVASRRPIVHSS